MAFALTPAQAQAGPIRFGTKEGDKIFAKATEALPELHDLSASNLRDFLHLVEQRANNFEWAHIMEIPKEPMEHINEMMEDREFINMLKHYGNVTLDQVRDHAKLYVNTETRAAQDSYQLAECIFQSLTKEARNTVTLYSDEYTINGRVSGACLLKVTIRESHIDTNATTRIIREKLSNLDGYMVSIDSDIIKFNEHVKELLDKLHARGEMTQDLLTNIFKAYKVVSDEDFVNYIKGKEDDYDEGKNDITPKSLMLLAANKYKTRKETNEWNAPSKEQEEIIALKAQVEKLKNQKANKQGSPKQPEGENRKVKRGEKRRKSKPKWMLLPPNQGEPHKKIVSGKDYYWCATHEAWGRHEKCMGLGYIPKKRKQDDGNKNDKDSEKTKTNANGKVKMANALWASLQE